MVCEIQKLILLGSFFLSDIRILAFGFLVSIFLIKLLNSYFKKFFKSYLLIIYSILKGQGHEIITG
jgi:hypothetical protein